MKKQRFLLLVLLLVASLIDNFSENFFMVDNSIVLEDN